MSTEIRQKVKAAQDVFKSCPKCGSPNLIFIEDEAICSYCGWDSILLRTEALYRKTPIRRFKKKSH